MAGKRLKEQQGEIDMMENKMIVHLEARKRKEKEREAGMRAKKHSSLTRH